MRRTTGRPHREHDSVVMVSAVAPAKTAGMLMRNLRMAEAGLRACCPGSRSPIVVYVSSDAIYADDANTGDRSLASCAEHAPRHDACGARAHAEERPRKRRSPSCGRR